MGGIEKIIELKESGKIEKDVCSFFNISFPTLESFLEKNNLKWSDLGKYGNNTSFYRIDTMGGVKKIIEFKGLGKTKKDVCLFFNISCITLYEFLKENNLKWSNLGKYDNRTSFYHINTMGGIEKIVELKESGKNIKDVCSFFDISRNTFYDFLKKNDVKWSNLGKYGNNTSFYYIDSVGGIKKINALIKKGYTKTKICDIIKINHATLRKYIKFHKEL